MLPFECSRLFLVSVFFIFHRCRDLSNEAMSFWEKDCRGPTQRFVRYHEVTTRVGTGLYHSAFNGRRIAKRKDRSHSGTKRKVGISLEVELAKAQSINRREEQS